MSPLNMNFEKSVMEGKASNSFHAMFTSSEFKKLKELCNYIASINLNSFNQQR
jgi:hypothetical protein